MTEQTNSTLNGTLAQAGGGACATLIVAVMASYGHYFQAGVESSLGTILSISGYLLFKKLRRK